MTTMLDNRVSWEATYRNGWLSHYQTTGTIDWGLYNRPKNGSDVAGPAVDLSQSRLMLISTAGAYLPASQAPFDAAHDLGDYSIRRLPFDTPAETLDYAHDHYDQTAVRADSQVLLPTVHLRALQKAGVIGELAPSIVSFMGYQPDVGRVLDETYPALLEVVEEEAPDAVLFVPS